MQKHIIQFINAIKKQKYFEAHEYLEEIWFPRRFENSNEIKMLKGFINAAVSFELHKRKKEKRSIQVWSNYLKYRQLLFKLPSTYKNDFYKVVRFLDSYHLKTFSYLNDVEILELSFEVV